MRRLAGGLLTLFATSCALHSARSTNDSSAATTRALVAQASATAAPPTAAPVKGTVQASAAAPAAPSADSCQVAIKTPEDAKAEAESEDEGDDAEGGSDDEAEAHDESGVDYTGNRYTADLSDEQLQQLWKSSPEKLGSISIGFTDEGRMINSVQFPCGEGWIVVSPERAYGTQETIAYVQAAIAKVRQQFPNTLPLRVNQISAKDGGYLRPHKSHQAGRDVDLAFYYPTVAPIRAREREKVIDVPRTWALLRAVITETDVQMVLLDKHVQKVLYDYALKTGDDKAWLDSIFHNGQASIVKHARHHRDHMHVRFFNGRAQELGRRVAPLLAQRPEQNLVFHRVHQGDTLGAIARRYGTSVEGLRKANHIKGSMLHLAQVLKVPLRGPCTHCPVPPSILVPARRLPPQLAAASAAPVGAPASAAMPAQVVAASGVPSPAGAPATATTASAQPMVAPGAPSTAGAPADSAAAAPGKVPSPVQVMAASAVVPATAPKNAATAAQPASPGHVVPATATSSATTVQTSSAPVAQASASANPVPSETAATAAHAEPAVAHESVGHPSPAASIAPATGGGGAPMKTPAQAPAAVDPRASGASAGTVAQ